MKYGWWLVLIAIASMANTEEVDRPIAITNLTSGSLVGVGQNVEVRIRALESATEVFVLGPCLDQAPARAEKVGAREWVWRGKVINLFSITLSSLFSSNSP